MNHEIWINDILNSTDGMIKVVPNDLLFSKIQHAIKVENNISNKWIWAAAAAFLLLFSLNSLILFSKNHKKINQTELVLITISKNNQLY
jgi:hypothetical protein